MVKILHTVLLDSETFFLWAEDTVLYGSNSIAKHSGKSTVSDINGSKSTLPAINHPFSVKSSAVLQAIGEVKGKKSKKELILPSISSMPVGSPELKSLVLEKQSKPKSFESFAVEGVLVQGSEAFRFFFNLGSKRETHFISSDSVEFLARLSLEAANLVGRGRVLPKLRSGSARKLKATWGASPFPADVALLAKLADKVPLSLGAQSGASKVFLGGSVVVEALDALTDGACRLAVVRLPFPKVGPKVSLEDSELWTSFISDLYGEVPKGFKDGSGKVLGWLEAWNASVNKPSEKFKTCFRLVEPSEEEDDESWRVEFMAQPVEDPSLFVPAEEIWDRAAVAGAIVAPGEDPAEAFLSDLGKAAKVCPDLEVALSVKRPTAMSLDRKGVQEFLSKYSGILEQSGFPVLTPAWLGSGKGRLGVRLRYKSGFEQEEDSGDGYFSKERLAEFDYVLAIGEAALTEAEVHELARLKAPLVRIRGQWIEFSQADLSAALKAIKTRPTVSLTLLEMLKVAGGLSEPIPGLSVTGVDAQGAIGEFLSGEADFSFKEISPPKTLDGELRPYQVRGLSWLKFLDRLGLGACLADDMGLGKTIQLISLLLLEKELVKSSSKSTPPTLLIAPMSLVGNWQREVEKFAGSLKLIVHHGAERQSGAKFRAAVRGADLVITTYGLAVRDKEMFEKITWHRVVLDEAQAIKNSTTNQFKAVKSLKTNRRVALTGTPIENRLTELWSLMEFLNPGFLGAKESFKNKFSTPIERYGDDNAAKKLKNLTAPLILRRLKTDKEIISDLPEKIEMKVFCNLTKEQASLYQSVVDDMMDLIAHADGITRRGLILKTLLRLKQICDHPALFSPTRNSLSGRSGKLDRLEEIVEEIVETGERALVFSQYAEMAEMLTQYFSEIKGVPAALIRGKVTKSQRDSIVESFQGFKGPSILVASLKAGGVGLNLTAANHVIHFDRWWNQAVEDQASDRAYRIGQTRDVQVRKFICVGTLEETIDEVIEGKRALSKRVIGSGESWLTELSTDDLISIVKLSADALQEV